MSIFIAINALHDFATVILADRGHIGAQEAVADVLSPGWDA